MSKKEREALILSEPIDFEISDVDDLARIPAALDEIATRLAEFPAWSQVPDIDSEALDSLLTRAVDRVSSRARKRLKDLVEIAQSLEAIAGSIRYGTLPDEEIDEAEKLRNDLQSGLDDLEEALE